MAFALVISVSTVLPLDRVGGFSLILNLYEEGSTIVREGLTLGMDDSATSGFDPEFDALLPPPVGVGYHFYSDTTEPYNRLTSDFRNTAELGSIWYIDKMNYSFGANVLWNDSSAIFSEDSATVYFKVIGVFDSIPECPFFDSTWSTLFGIDTINYNPTLQRLVMSVDHYTPTRIRESLPEDYTILPPRPNPFNSSVSIIVQTLEKQDISGRIFDILGNEISTMTSCPSIGGTQLLWNGKDLTEQASASGIYLMKVYSGKFDLATYEIFLVK